MKLWFQQLDQILRGQTTSLSAIRGGRLNIHIRGLIFVLILLGSFYGFCMGWYAMLNGAEKLRYMQVLALRVLSLSGYSIVTTVL